MTDELDKIYVQWVAERLVENCRNIPNYAWFGDQDLGHSWAFVFSVTRDCTAVDQHRHDRVAKSLVVLYPEDAIATESSHWLCGWVKQVLVRLLEEDGAVSKAGRDVVKRICLREDLEPEEVAIMLEQRHGPLTDPRIAQASVLLEGAGT